MEKKEREREKTRKIYIHQFFVQFLKNFYETDSSDSKTLLKTL